VLKQRYGDPSGRGQCLPHFAWGKRLGRRQYSRRRIHRLCMGIRAFTNFFGAEWVGFLTGLAGAPL